MHYILYFTVIKKRLGFTFSSYQVWEKIKKEYLEKKSLILNFITYHYLHKEEPSFRGTQVLVICLAVSVLKNQSGLEYRPIRNQYLEI